MIRTREEKEAYIESVAERGPIRKPRAWLVNNWELARELGPCQELAKMMVRDRALRDHVYENGQLSLFRLRRSFEGVKNFFDPPAVEPYIKVSWTLSLYDSARGIVRGVGDPEAVKALECYYRSMGLHVKDSLLGTSAFKPSWDEETCLARSCGKHMGMKFIDGMVTLDFEVDPACVGPWQVGSGKVGRGEDLVDSLWLTVRSANVLQNMGVRTVGQLIACTAEDILRAKNAGQKVVADIRKALLRVGLALSIEG